MKWNYIQKNKMKNKKARVEMTPSHQACKLGLSSIFVILEQIVAHVTIRRRFLCWTEQLQGSVWEARSAAVSCGSTADCSIAAAKWCEEGVLYKPAACRGLSWA